MFCVSFCLLFPVFVDMCEPLTVFFSELQRRFWQGGAEELKELLGDGEATSDGQPIPALLDSSSEAEEKASPRWSAKKTSEDEEVEEELGVEETKEPSGPPAASHPVMSEAKDPSPDNPGNGAAKDVGKPTSPTDDPEPDKDTVRDSYSFLFVVVAVFVDFVSSCPLSSSDSG